MLALPDQKPPTLIITDYWLPGGVDGLALIEAVRERCGRSLPAIVLTGDITTRFTETDRLAV